MYHHFGPEFELTMVRRHVRDAWLYSWTVIVRAEEGGPVIYRTPQPQRFNPDEPIIILVEPVN